MCIPYRSKLILESVSQFFGIFQSPKKAKVLEIPLYVFTKKIRKKKTVKNVEGVNCSLVENFELARKIDILPWCQTAVDPRVLEVVISVHVMGSHDPLEIDLIGYQ